MRLVVLLLVVWLVIGVVAAGQRHYLSGSTTDCAKVGTVLVTILAGPLNYLGVNPKISCEARSRIRNQPLSERRRRSATLQREQQVENTR